MDAQAVAVRLFAAGDDVPARGFDGVVDRFMIDGADTEGRFALVQHLFAPRALAAPMHRHHDEDEYTFVLTGRIGAILEGQEVMAEPGDLTEPATPEQGNEMAAPYHCDTNMDSTFPLVERHGLRF